MVIKLSKNSTMSLDEEEQESEKISQDVMVIAREVKIVQSLVCNDPMKRQRQVRKLGRWLELRSKSTFPFTEDDFLRIWKGLYYNMWLSDKPLAQEKLAEQLARLLVNFGGDVAMSANFYGAFLVTMCQQWFGIDQWRIDKFLMLTRRMLRYMLYVLKDCQWSFESICLFNEHTERSVLANDITAKGLTMHYLDIFLEELAKVSEGKMNATHIDAFVDPFISFVATNADSQLVVHCRDRIFYHLLYQSEMGRDYMERYDAWKSMGFPTASIYDLEKIESASDVGEEEDDDDRKLASTAVEKQLDPRAGMVDVFIPILPLNGQFIIEEFDKFLYSTDVSTKRRKVIRGLQNCFQTYQNGQFPLGVKNMPRVQDVTQMDVMEKISSLDRLENEVYGTKRQLKKLNKRQRRKLLKSLNLEDVDENNYDQIIAQALPKNSDKTRKRKANQSILTGWIEEELSEVELPPRKQKKDVIIELEKAVKLNKKIQKHAQVHEEKPKQRAEKSSQKGKKAKSETQSSQQQQQKTKMQKSIHILKPTTASAPNAPTLQLSAAVHARPKKAVTDTHKISTDEKSISKHPESISGRLMAEWERPLLQGELEYFVNTRKQQVDEANRKLVRNPLARPPIARENFATPSPKPKTIGKHTPLTGSTKRVKISLDNNTSQNPSEYIQQVKNSPKLPFDAAKKPGKGLLKPNLIPSPINPFYKKKIGLDSTF